MEDDVATVEQRIERPACRREGGKGPNRLFGRDKLSASRQPFARLRLPRR